MGRAGVALFARDRLTTPVSAIALSTSLPRACASLRFFVGASREGAWTTPANMADYVTAKHALEGLSKALAAEWAGDGIRVNMVSPGLTRTELTEFQHERVFKMEAARTPLRRLATPADIARAVAYLALDDSAFLTGTNLFVTGGQVML